MLSEDSCILTKMDGYTFLCSCLCSALPLVFVSYESPRQRSLERYIHCYHVTRREVGEVLTNYGEVDARVSQMLAHRVPTIWFYCYYAFVWLEQHPESQIRIDTGQLRWHDTILTNVVVKKMRFRQICRSI